MVVWPAGSVNGMIIRPEQMDSLSAAAEQNFLRQLVEEMREFAPWHAEVLGDSGLTRCVQFALQRSGQYGFTNRGPIRLYLQMIFLLGAEFDSDPLLPWAGEVLSDPLIVNQTDRAAQLYAGLNEYLKLVAGPNNKFAKDALVRARDELSSGLGGASEDIRTMIFDKMRRVYPEKCAYSGDAAVQKSIRFGIAAAARHSAATNRGASLFCGLIFALGHGFETDPHLPWIQKTLQDPALTEDKLVQRLSTRVKTYLDYVVANIL
jgi:hypothetical protein